MKKLLLILVLLTAGQLYGQDRLFTYTYQSTVLGKGQKELEVWNTFRIGRENYYFRYDNRTEFEVGLGSNLQTAFYLNLTQQTKQIASDSGSFLNTETEFGFSNEWKYKILDPVANPIGLALYAEFGIGSNEFELETKLILDKQVKKVTLAANAMYEVEFKPEVEEHVIQWEYEQAVDVNLAVAYSFSRRFAITNENSFRNILDEGNLEHSALYSGLGFSLTMENFWVNLTILPQVVSFKEKTNGSLDLAEFDKAQCRLLFSYVF